MIVNNLILLRVQNQIPIIFPRSKRHLLHILNELMIKVMRILQAWFELEWLPSYAPELNPVEMVWNHTKYADLANFIPEDVDHLLQEVNASIAHTGQNGCLIRSFFNYAGLEL